MYVIKSTTEKDDDNKPLYWNNDDGWVDEKSATVFTDREMLAYKWLPLSSIWERL